MGRRAQPNAAILTLIPDRSDPDVRSVEGEAIVHVNRHNPLKNPADMLAACLSMAKEVRIAGFAMSSFDPEGNKHASLQDETVPLRRNRETVEQPLKRVADKHHIIGSLRPAGDVQQPLLDRGCTRGLGLSHRQSAPRDRDASSSTRRPPLRPVRSLPAWSCAAQGQRGELRWRPSGRPVCCETRRQVL